MRKITSYIFILSLAVQSPASELTEILQESQKVAQTEQSISFVWWMPQVFWKANFDQNPALTEGQKSEILRRLKEYTIFGVTQSDIGTFGSFTHKEKREIRENILFELNGDEIEELPYIVVDQEVSNLLISMKPVLAQTMGELGKGLEFFVYPNEVANEVLLDPRNEGSFTFTSFDNEFKWRLPMASLLPPMIDKETNESFPGNYIYNPYNGNKLEKKEQVQPEGAGNET